jgi:hypothetical protein
MATMTRRGTDLREPYFVQDKFEGQPRMMRETEIDRQRERNRDRERETERDRETERQRGGGERRERQREVDLKRSEDKWRRARIFDKSFGSKFFTILPEPGAALRDEREMIVATYASFLPIAQGEKATI